MLAIAIQFAKRRNPLVSEFCKISLDSPLRELLLMQTRGKLRRSWKKVSSPRRAIPTILVAVLMLLYVLQVYIALAFRESSGNVPIAQIAPLGMLSILLMKLLAVCVDRKKSGAGYRDEEIHNLIGGPFSLDQVRLFRICGHAVSIFFTSIFAAVFFRFHVASFFAALSGAFLAMLFTYLVYSTVAVAAVNAPDKVYNWIRNICCCVVGSLFAFVLFRVSQRSVSNLEFLRACGEEAIMLSQTLIGRALMSPFRVFSNVVVAESAFQWLAWIGPSLLLNYVALQALLQIEVALDERTKHRMRSDFSERDAQGTLTSAADQTVSFADAGFDKTLPWLYGAGPIIWRQVRAIRRLRGGLGWLLLPLSLAFSVGGYLAYDPQQGAFQTIAVIVVLTSVFLPGLLPFDFRGDLKGLSALKMMPLSPQSVVVGQLTVPVCILTVFQLGALSTLVLHDRSLVSSVLLTMCFLLPTNTIILALENLVFLLYPYRVSEFDMQATIRRIVMLMMKFCVIFFAALLAALAGLGVLGLKLSVGRWTWLSEAISRWHQPLFYVSQFCVLSGVAVGVLWATCWAYRRFDLSEDLPV